MISKIIKEQYKIAKKRGWDRMYWAIDLHSTLIKPNYSDTELPTDYYKNALDTMRILSKREDIILIMYTCSWPKEIKKYLKNFESDGIHFNYVNKNPEVKTKGYGYYEDKPYFNVLLDDKAGFNANKDWKVIYDTINKLKSL